MILSDSLCCFSGLRFYLQQFLWRFSCIQIISSPVSVIGKYEKVLDVVESPIRQQKPDAS